MIFLLLGGLLIGLSFLLNPEINHRFPKLQPIFRTLGLVLLLTGALSSAVRQVDAGFVGVTKLFGKVQPKVLNSGLHLVNPLIEMVEFDVRTHNYTMSGVNDEGNKSGDDAIRALTSDGLEVVIDLTVLYRLVPEKTPSILQAIGIDYENVFVRPITRTKIRDNAVYYDAVSLYSSKRDEFQNRIFKSIESDFNKRGLILEQLLVRNIQLPQSVKATIESKINAEQEAQKMQFVLQKEKQEAERKRVEAQGIADYNRIISAELTEKQLQYETIKMQKELATSPNSKIIIMGNGQKMPLILDGK